MLNFEIQHNQDNVHRNILSITEWSYSHKVTFVLGERIKAVRESKGLKLEELGEKITVSHSALSKIERGKTKPAKKTLIALAKELRDNFGEEWLDEHINQSQSVPSKKELAQEMSVKEFVSLKFNNMQPRRSKERIQMLSEMLDEELKKERESQ